MIRTMLRTLLLILVAAGGVADASAQQSQKPPRSTPPPTPTLPEVIAWLDCVECDAELKKLRSLDNPDKQLVPELRIVLLDGPSKDRLDRQERHLEKTYSALKEYEKDHPKQRVPLGPSEYVQLYRQKYIELNRSRAARALGVIGTPLAKGALADALKADDLPPALRRDIEVALKSGGQ
jgi:hypothetical protein